MKTILSVLVVLLVLGGCATSSSQSGNPESAQSKCKGTWDSRTGTCLGG